MSKRLGKWMVAAGLLLLAKQSAAVNLLQAYDMALQNDPKFAQATAERQVVEENLPLAIARLLPSIGFSATADDVNNNNKTGFTFTGGKRPDSYWNMSLNLKMSQPIYHHDYWVQLGQADSLIAQAEAEYRAAFQDMVVRTVQAYFQILAQKDFLEFATAEKTAIARQLDQAQQRFEVGFVAITDVHEAQAAYDLATAGEIKAQNELEKAKEALREIIGETVDQVTPLSEEAPLKTPEPTDVNQWAEHAISGNFAVIAAQNAVEVSRKQVSIQAAGHYPTLDLVASHTVTDSSRDYFTNASAGTFNPPNYQWQKLGPRYEMDSVGLQLSVPFFQGGAVNAKTRQATHDLEKAQHRLDEMLRAADRGTKDAYRDVVSSISQVKALKAAIRSSQSALEAAEAGLEVGTRTMVDVLTEQRNLYKAKQDYSQARYEYMIGSFLLKQASGILSRDDVEQANGWIH